MSPTENGDLDFAEISEHGEKPDHKHDKPVDKTSKTPRKISLKTWLAIVAAVLVGGGGSGYAGWEYWLRPKREKDQAAEQAKEQEKAELKKAEEELKITAKETISERVNAKLKDGKLILQDPSEGVEFVIDDCGETHKIEHVGAPDTAISLGQGESIFPITLEFKAHDRIVTYGADIHIYPSDSPDIHRVINFHFQK